MIWTKYNVKSGTKRDGDWCCVIGGIVGGIQGGIRAKKLGLSFWKGIGSSTSDISMPNVMPQSNERYGNNVELRVDYDNNIRSVDRMSLEEVEQKEDTNVSLGNDKKLAAGYKMDSSGNITNSKGQDVAGYTRRFKETFYGKLSSQITIAPVTKGYSLAIKNMIFKYDFMHAWHYSSGLSNFDAYSERATSMYIEVYSKAYGFSYSPPKYWILSCTIQLDKL